MKRPTPFIVKRINWILLAIYLCFAAAVYAKTKWPIDTGDSPYDVIMENYPEIVDMKEVMIRDYYVSDISYIPPVRYKIFIVRHKDGAIWMYKYSFLSDKGWKISNQVYRHSLSRSQFMSTEKK